MENTEYQSEENSQFDIKIKDIIEWTLANKIQICLCIFICVLIGLFYAYKTSPTYLRSSTVMLRSDTQGNSQIGELAAFADLGMMSTSLDIYNEIEAFRSPSLMLQVVERLNLNIKYSKKNWFGRVTDLYKNSPIEIDIKSIAELEDQAINSFSFNVKKKDDTIVAYKFIANKKDIDVEPIQLNIGKETPTPVGVIVAKTTPIFSNDFEEPITISYGTVENVGKAFSSRFKANMADKYSTVLTFEFVDTSIKRAEDVLNTLLDIYNEEWKEYMDMSVNNTSKFINERLEVIEEELGLVDKDIERFKSSNQLIDIKAETAQITEASSNFNEKSFAANNQLSIAEYIQDYLSDKSKQFDLLPSNSGIESNHIEQQISEYNKLILDRQRLLSNSSDKNPLIIGLNDQIAMLRTTIIRSIDNLINTLKIEIAKIDTEERQISNRISSNPGKIRELVQIERQQKIKEQLYLYLLQKREESELSANLVVNNTRVLKPAMGNSTPIAPNKAMILIISLAAGLVIPYGYMFLSFHMNNTIRGRKDAETTNIPIVGEIPFIGKVTSLSRIKKFLKREEDTLPQILVKARSRNVINEAFRLLRTNLDFMMINDKETPVVMITSFHVSSGKSFTSLNLAASIAIKGKKAIIIDLDIRKGTVSNTVGKTSIGVVNYLNGQADIDEIVKHNINGIENLSVITTGTLPPNPAELLLSHRLEELIAELQKQYDYIFIDCPPIGIVADTTIISRVATRTIFAMRVGLFDRNLLPELERIYKENQFPNMCLLVNGCKSYGYGYGHGYGETDK